MAEVFYENGNEFARVANTFSVAGVATDPTTVALVITDPEGVATTYTYPADITKDSTGAYHKDIACSVDGTWQYVWIGTGDASDIQPGTWRVERVDLQRLYCTPEVFKARAGLAQSDILDDLTMIKTLRAASRWADTQCDRVFYRVTEARTFSPCHWNSLDIDDLIEATEVRTDEDGDGVFETVWSASDYQLLPVNPFAGPEPRPYTSIKAVGTRTFPRAISLTGRTNLAQVTGPWGWPRTPDAVEEAVAIVAADLFKIKDAPFGIAGMGEFGGMRVRNNPRAIELLAPYKKHRILVG